ncbi:MAG: zinc ribbon domain-containing protein [Elusimicrobia bacterium]|nr:zinc ribbon domain-containing protein [Elusimicrobiota bacterium]
MSDRAGVLRCPSCGAPTAPEARECAHCRANLHPIRCPWCFGWTFTEARDCAYCGSQAAEEASAAACPGCREPLSTRSLKRARLSGCVRCGGVWADSASFRVICDDRETQASYLGEGSPLPAPAASDPSSSPIAYRPCAVCAELMNRFNFAGCSGVIIDVCKPHGVWFDPDELRRIVAFIRGGGMDVARAKEQSRLEHERRRLERAMDDRLRASDGFQSPGLDSVASARDLLRFLLDNK